MGKAELITGGAMGAVIMAFVAPKDILTGAPNPITIAIGAVVGAFAFDLVMKK